VCIPLCGLQHITEQFSLLLNVILDVFFDFVAGLNSKKLYSADWRWRRPVAFPSLCLPWRRWQRKHWTSTELRATRAWSVHHTDASSDFACCLPSLHINTTRWTQWRIQEGVQGVQTPALLFRCHFFEKNIFWKHVITVFRWTGCFVNTKQELWELVKGFDIALDVVRPPGANYFF